MFLRANEEDLLFEKVRLIAFDAAFCFKGAIAEVSRVDVRRKH